MKKNAVIIVFALAALALAAGPVLAHDMWLTLDKPAVGKKLHIVAGYGHAFPADEGTDKNMLAPAYIVGAKGKIATSPGKKLDFISKSALAKGSYVVVSGRKSQFYSKTPAGYVNKTKDQLPECLRCLRSTKYSKAIVNLEATAKNVTRPVGQLLEVVPLVNPGAVKPGGELPVLVLFKGKPLAKTPVFGTYVGFSKHKNYFAFHAKTDAKGKAYVKLSAPGLWLVVAKQKVPYKNPAKCDHDAHAASLTFLVK